MSYTRKELCEDIYLIESLNLPASEEHKRRTKIFEKYDKDPNQFACLGQVSPNCDEGFCDLWHECFHYMGVNIDGVIVLGDEK